MNLFESFESALFSLLDKIHPKGNNKRPSDI